MVLNKKTLDNYDGINDMLKETLNTVLRALKLSPSEKRQLLTTLLIKYETYLKKLYYLINGKEVPAKEEGKNATLANAIFAIPSLKNLMYSTTPAYKAFSERLNILRDLRNTESHGSISISEKEIDAAVHVVIDMYLFVTATNITELEMSGHYPDVADMVSINKTFVQDENIGMAADPLL